MRWPGRIQAGSVVDDPIIGIDLVPTMLEAAGAEIDPAWEAKGVDQIEQTHLAKCFAHAIEFLESARPNVNHPFAKQCFQIQFVLSQQC